MTNIIGVPVGYCSISLIVCIGKWLNDALPILITDVMRHERVVLKV